MYQRQATDDVSGAPASHWISLVIWLTLLMTFGIGIAAQGLLGPVS